MTRMNKPFVYKYSCFHTYECAWCCDVRWLGIVYLQTKLKFVDWLSFFAVSTIFQPFNDSCCYQLKVSVAAFIPVLFSHDDRLDLRVLGAILLSTCFVKSWRITHQTHSEYDWSVYWLAFFLICKFHWFWRSNHFILEIVVWKF